MTPARLVAEAEAAGLSAVALCDHNTVAGLPEFLAAARGKALEAVPGVEFSTEYLGQEVHILGLFVAPAHFETVSRRLRQLLEEKDRCNRALVQALTGHAMPMDYDAIKAATPGGVVNRAVIAAEMVRQGYCSSIRQALQQWLSKERGLYQPPRLPDTVETLRFIRSLGAVSVLAHPFLSLEEDRLRQLLAMGELDAMETRYAAFTPEQETGARALAEEFGLLHSGGSDFHGSNKPDIALGTGRGNLAVPEEILEKLRRCSRKGIKNYDFDTGRKFL